MRDDAATFQLQRSKGAAPFILGLAVIRGTPVPVVDSALLLGSPHSNPGRFVTLKTGERSVALAVDQVIGVRHIPNESFQNLPPLLLQRDSEAIATIGMLDMELLLVLSAAVFVPDSVWHDVESRESA